ncbi:MAG: hypothetical protein DHS20C19_26780 [Acidimicrobiales bacterium]|nr:MAG: hypothetical protein DHS20C19_26780 [Acidimicrobiales bacterium]
MTIQPTAREAIRDVLAAYCRGIDRRDRSLVTACFHPDATDDHGAGPRTRDDFVAWCFDLLAGYGSTFHFLGQSTFDFETSDTARVETYGIAGHRTPGGPDHRNLTTGFRYLDRFEDRGDGWRITSRLAITDWSRVDREGDWWAVPDTLAQGSAGPDDPSHRR